MPASTPATREIFWGEISPCEHLVQIYEHDETFLDALEGFVAGGLRGGDGVIIIATPSHRADLEARLADQGLDLDLARSRDRFISLDAEETLASFMVNGWPDPDLFIKCASELLQRARGNGRRVRAFGEMVAVMWARGQYGATVQLEHLWHDLCRAEAFSLFCAYPKIGFTEDMASSIDAICAAHSKFVHE